LICGKLQERITLKKVELLFAAVLVPLDVAMIIAAFLVAYIFRAHIETSQVFGTTAWIEYFKYLLYLLPLWLIIFALNGLYEIKPNRGFFNTAFRIFISNSVAMLFLILIIFFSKVLFFSRLVLALTWLFTVITVIVGRFLIREFQIYLYRYSIGIRSVIIVGSNEAGDFLAAEIKNNPNFGYKLLGIVNGEHRNKSRMKCVGKIEDFNTIIDKYHPTEVFLAQMNLDQKTIGVMIDKCIEKKIPFKFIPDILAAYSLNVRTNTLGSMPLFEVKTIALDGWGRIIKRVFDVAFSAFILMITFPLTLIVAILEKITSRGPVFYTHERVGRDGKNFKVYKFRSMYTDAEEKTKTFWTIKDDPRVTPLGMFLRKSNIDELPQCYNILKGDMSFVGPRPEQPRFVAEFEKDIPDYMKRHRVKSGLTGWAQVNGLKGDTSIAKRVRYDMFYIENWSLLFDLKIILRTIWLLVYEMFIGKYEYRAGS
jgi:exopolysaccharide biosynthesis polyprenyl glycosylphosphotransferase